MKWQSEEKKNKKYSIGRLEIDFILFYEDHSFHPPYNSIAQRIHIKMVAPD